VSINKYYWFHLLLCICSTYVQFKNCFFRQSCCYAWVTLISREVMFSLLLLYWAIRRLSRANLQPKKIICEDINFRKITIWLRKEVEMWFRIILWRAWRRVSWKKVKWGVCKFLADLSCWWDKVVKFLGFLTFALMKGVHLTKAFLGITWSCAHATDGGLTYEMGST